MFKLLDFLFEEEKERGITGKRNTESAVLHQKVEALDKTEEWSEKEIKDAVYKSRFALVGIYSQINRTNIILRWIRLLLLFIFLLLAYKLI